MLWTAQSLSAALNAEKFETNVITDNALAVKLKEFSDLNVAIVINGQFMKAEAILVAEKDVVEPQKLDRLLMKATDFLNLSSFTVRDIDGESVYAILGESSASSKIENVELELNTIAENAYQAATLIEKHNETTNK